MKARTVVGPVGAVVGVRGMGLVLLGRHQKGRDPDQLQLLARHVLRPRQKLQLG